MSTTKEPVLGAEMPLRTPGRSDFARPTFALGRISLGSSFTSDDETPGSRRSLSAPPSAGSGTLKPLQASSAGSYDIPVCQTPHTKEKLHDSYCRAQPKPSSFSSSPFSGDRNLDTRRLSSGCSSSFRSQVNCDGAILPEGRRSPENWRGTGTAVDDGKEPSCRGATDVAGGCDQENVSPTTCRYAGSGSGTPFRKPDALSTESRFSWQSYHRRSPLGHAQEHCGGREDVSPATCRYAGSDSGTPFRKPDPLSSESRSSWRSYHHRSQLGHAQEHRGGKEDVSPLVYQYGGGISVTPLPQQDPMNPEFWQSSSPRRSPAAFTHELSDHRESDGGYKRRKHPSPTVAAAVAIQQRGSSGELSYGSPIGTPVSRAKSGSSSPVSPAGSDGVDGATFLPASTPRYVNGSSSKTSSPGIHALNIHSPQSMQENQDRWGTDPHGSVSLGPGGQGSGTTGCPANRGRIPSYKGRSYSGGDDIGSDRGDGNSSSDREESTGNIDARSEDENRSSASTTRASPPPPADEDDVMLVQDSKYQSRMDCREDGQKAPGEWEEEVGGLRWKMEAEKEKICETSRKLGVTATESEKPLAFSVPAELYKRMYPHQREGVRWLWGLHQGDMGGILGDDMGMGKTFQVTAFLAGLFSTEQATCALVLAPKSVMRGWETELREWLVEAAAPTVQVLVLTSGMSASVRKRMILGAMKGGDMGGGAVVVTSYGLVSAKPELFAPRGNELKWDYVVLDEGHKIKNSSTRTCKAVHVVPAWRRLMLTGTPIQNNLEELYTVVDWVTFGGLFRTRNYFKDTFSRPIEGGQDRDASERTVTKSRARAAELRQLLAPYLLQRNKEMIMERTKTTKTEIVVWVALSRSQRRDYAAYLGGESVLDVLSGKISSPLAAIQALKKITLHTMLASYPLGRPWRLESHYTVDKLVKDSRKLAVVLKIVADARENGHRVLVFSRFVRMLDILERCIGEPKAEGGLGLKMARIDGSHSDLERKDTIAKYNGNESIAVCLVSTGAGGTGITLTGANRVIIFDPSWNPADDMQAVDRAYRIGQSRDVIVYRMIAAGTVEEKMYEKQVFKDGLRKTVMGGSTKRKKNVRYFSRAELKELFTLFPPGTCRVLEQLESMHGSLRERLEASESSIQRNISFGGHLDFLCDLVGSYGASAHGDFLPKIIRPDAAIATSGGGGGGGGSRCAPRSRPIIAEEEDESEIEIDDGEDGHEHGAEVDFDLSDYYNDPDEACRRSRTRKVYAGSAKKSRRFSGGDGKGDHSEGGVSDSGVGNDSFVEVGGSDFETGSDEDGDSGNEGGGGCELVSGDEVKDPVVETEQFGSETVGFNGNGNGDDDSSDYDFAIEVPPPASSIGYGGAKSDNRNGEDDEGVLSDSDLFQPRGNGDDVEHDTEEDASDQPWTEKRDDMDCKDLGIGAGVVSQDIVGFDADKADDDEVQSKAGNGESCQEGVNASMAIVIDSDSESDDIEPSRKINTVDTPSPEVHLKTEYPVDDSVRSQPVLPPMATSTDRGDHSDSPRTWETSPIPTAFSSPGKLSGALDLGSGNISTISTPQYGVSPAERGGERIISEKKGPGKNTSGLDSSSPLMSRVKGDANRGGAASDASTGKAQARQWAKDVLGISPVVSASSCGESLADEREFHGSLADEKASRVAAARERARMFAKEKLGIDACCHSEDDDDGPVIREVEPDESRVCGGSSSCSRGESPSALLASMEAFVEEGETIRIQPKETGLGPASTADALVPAPAFSTDEAGVSTRKKYVCSNHAKLAEIGGFKCFRCRCIVGAKAAEEAQVLLLSAWKHERNGDLFDAAEECLKAIELCDEDRELHKTIKRIGTQIGAF